MINYFVPVVDRNQNPLMPTNISRAFRWIKSGKATPFYKKGIFCVRLNYDLPVKHLQEIVIGVDPGSKEEGFTIKSTAHTYLNVQSEAIQHVKDAVETRRDMRRTRRNRKTPCRKPRFNKAKGGLPPSTKARWDIKLRVKNWLKKIFPIKLVTVEDIKAKTKSKRRWDMMFSPLQVGKKYFYSQLENLILKQGWETKELRDKLGLKKLKNKLSKDFHAHCVDIWVLANDIVGGHTTPDNKKVVYLKPLRFHRRQLHVMQPGKGGFRKYYGGTRSLGFKRGSLVKHKKYGVCYVGGTSKGRISLHDTVDGKRLSQNIKVEDCRFLCYNSWLIN